MEEKKVQTAEEWLREVADKGGPVFVGYTGQKPVGKSGTKMYGNFMCPICKKPFECIVANVKSGNTKSCGCNEAARRDKMNITHGLSKTAAYSRYRDMIQRCTNPKNQDWKSYGGKGIRVCDEWTNDFLSYYNWCVSMGYKSGLQVDRICNDGDYSPENCRIVTPSENVQNSRLLKSTNKSGYRGVYWGTQRGKWIAAIKANKKRHHLGFYSSKIDAARAYNKFVTENNTFHPLNPV